VIPALIVILDEARDGLAQFLCAGPHQQVTRAFRVSWNRSSFPFVC
jgi:hypothetical protein